MNAYDPTLQKKMHEAGAHAGADCWSILTTRWSDLTTSLRTKPPNPHFLCLLEIRGDWNRVASPAGVDSHERRADNIEGWRRWLRPRKSSSPYPRLRIG